MAKAQQLTCRRAHDKLRKRADRAKVRLTEQMMKDKTEVILTNWEEIDDWVDRYVRDLATRL